MNFMRIMLMGRNNSNEMNGQLALHNIKYNLTSTADGPSRGQRNDHGNVNPNGIGVHKCTTQSQKEYQMILIL